MKKLIQLLTFVFLFGASAGHSQNFQWAQTVGGSGDDFGLSVTATDASGNVYIGGSFEGMVDFDPGPGTHNLSSIGSGDAFVLKLDREGNFVWVSRIGGLENDVVSGIAVDASGNPFLTGYFNSTACDFDPGPGTHYLASNGSDLQAFVARLNQSGGYAWAFGIGNQSYNDIGNNIILDASGNVYVCGYFRGTVDFDPGAAAALMTAADQDGFLIKTTALGSLVFAKQFAGTGAASPTGISLDPSGNILLSGEYSGTIDLDPTAAADNHVSNGSTDAFFCMLNSVGNLTFGSTFGSSGSDQAQSIAADLPGNIYVSGHFTGTVDFGGSSATSNFSSKDLYIARYNPAGVLSWVKSWGGDSNEYTENMAIDRQSNIYMIGGFLGTVDFDPAPADTFNLSVNGSPFYQDIYITKLDGVTGNFKWAVSFGSNLTNDMGFGIGVDTSYNVYATGLYRATVDFNPGAGTDNHTYGGGIWDAWVMKLDQCYVATSAGPDQTLCAGSLTTLTAAGAGSYVWSTGAASSAIAVGPLTTTTYVVTGTDFPGCSLNDTVVITVNPLPNVEMGMDSFFCSNSYVIGVLPEASVTYTITANPNYIYSNNSQYTINPVGDTVTYFLQAQNTVSGCVALDSVHIYIRPEPTVSLGNDIIMCGDSVSIGTANELFVTYSWTSNPPGFFSTLNSQYVSPAVPTGYVITAVGSVYNCTVTDTINVTLHHNPSLTLNGQSAIHACFGDTLQLGSILTPGGGTPPYTLDWWYGPAHLYGSNPTYTVTGSYTFNVSVADSNSCTGFTTSFSVLMDGSSNADLVGHVTTPLPADVTNGLVYAFRYHPGRAGGDTIANVPLDASGKYIFTALDNGSYLIKTLPDTAAYPQAVPTYYGNEFQWDSSVVVIHGCMQTDTADIEVLEVFSATGPGSISGYIFEQLGYGNGGSRLNGGIHHPDVPCVPGSPLKGIDIKLGKYPGTGIQARTTSDTAGYYQFDNLPLQGYRIYVDIPNLPMDTIRVVVLDAGNSVSVQNNYYADSASVYIADTTIIAVGIYSSEKVYENNFTVFPNPAKDQLSLSFDLSKAGDVEIEISNAIGQSISSERIKDAPAGNFVRPVDIRSLHLKAGVYFISVLNENKKYTQRLVVME
ncbi:MAG: hypothetical protein K0S33_2807 [Bacteroidetes bacterium]|nr:hypothetical protein [Bacteroidota bacterium]